jgi:ParB/RepB/Spo0J family partition protein
MPEYKMLPIELLDEPELASRALLDQKALEELAESVKTKGVLEPLLVLAKDGRFEIMAGHRRYKAAQLAYLKEVPCLVHAAGEIDPEMVMLEENLCREDVTAAEQGWWILQLVEKKGYTMDQLVQRFRRSEDWINERVRLVQTDGVLARAVAERQISMSIAKELLRVTDEKARHYFLSQSITHGANTRTVNFWVDQWKRDQERQTALGPAGEPQRSTPALEAPASLPHCVFCGLRDAPENLIQVMAHFYHWRDHKRMLRDNGVEVFDTPRE